MSRPKTEREGQSEGQREGQREGRRDDREKPKAGRRWAYQRGRRAERLVAWYLHLKGFRTLARSYKGPDGSGLGEIDLVMGRGRLVLFVEVKARATLEAARIALTPRQQERIRRTAESWLAREEARRRPQSRRLWGGLERHVESGAGRNGAGRATLTARFDLLLVTPGPLGLPKITHIQNAW